jgi:hypothetical protein
MSNLTRNSTGTILRNSAGILANACGGLTSCPTTVLVTFSGVIATPPCPAYPIDAPLYPEGRTTVFGVNLSFCLPLIITENPCFWQIVTGAANPNVYQLLVSFTPGICGAVAASQAGVLVKVQSSVVPGVGTSYSVTAGSGSPGNVWATYFSASFTTSLLGHIGGSITVPNSYGVANVTDGNHVSPKTQGYGGSATITMGGC